MKCEFCGFNRSSTFSNLNCFNLLENLESLIFHWRQRYYTILQNKRQRWLWVPPRISLERQTLPPNKLYNVGKGILMASRVHFKYWKNILISRFFSNFREITPKWLSEKFQTFLKYEHIVCSFEARDLEILNMLLLSRFYKHLRNFCFAHIFTKFKYFAKQLILTESPDHVL